MEFGKWSEVVLKWRELTKWELVKVPIYRTAAGPKLLKTLLCSYCANNCKYCAFRKSRQQNRYMWNPDLLVRITLDLWKAGVIDGLFLTSSVYRDPDNTTEMQLEVVEKLRKSGFRGFIHLRIMPGTSRHLIRHAIELVDRAGINIEAPSSTLFNEIAPDKGDWYRDIINKLSYMIELSRSRGLLRGGVDTQVIVGFGDDLDIQHIRTSEMLFKMGVKRIYYSPFIPIKGTPLENQKPAPKWRIIRLFQVSELLRSYGYTSRDFEEILRNGMLVDRDPKELYAEAHPELFPVDLRTASLHEILKVPGIGPRSARKIIRLREESRLTISELKKVLGSRYRKVLKYITL